MNKKQKVQETIFNGSQYGADGWSPEDPAKFYANAVRADAVKCAQ